MAVSTRSTATVSLSGPFFSKDVEKTMMENIHKMMEGIAAEGATAARVNLAAGSASRALVRMTGDRVADHVIGRTVSRAGKQWYTAAVVQVDNKGLDAAGSRSLMAAASRIEGKTHSVRKVATSLRSSRAVLSANLTAGME